MFNFICIYNIHMSYIRNEQDVTSLYATGGASTLTLTDFLLSNGSTLTITNLHPHFHLNYSTNTFLSNTIGLYPSGNDTSIQYTPKVTSLSYTATLSANQSINPYSSGFYVVVIGGGGGGGGGRNNTGDDNGNGGAGGGSGAIVGYYFNFASNNVNPSGAYYKYIIGGVGGGGAIGINTTGQAGGNGFSSEFQLFNSSNTQIFSITCGGGLGGAGGKSTSQQPPPASPGSGGTVTVTGTAANITTNTINVKSNGAT